MENAPNRLRRRPAPTRPGQPGRAELPCYFFIMPPGEVALPVFSANPAVGAPWLLALPGDDVELPVVVAPAPFFMAVPPGPVVLPFMELPVVVLLAAGPPAAELPPALLPPVCAKASVPDSAKAAANAMVVIFMVVSLSCIWETKVRTDVMFPIRRRRVLHLWSYPTSRDGNGFAGHVREGARRPRNELERKNGRSGEGPAQRGCIQ